MINNKEIDHIILSQITNRWQKVAKIVGSILCEKTIYNMNVNDIYISERVNLLISDGKLKSQGSLDNMRNCEVRLAS